MMNCFRITDGSPEHDLFVIVCCSAARRKQFFGAWAKAVAQAKEENPDEWNRTEVLDIMRRMGWDLMAPNYETVHEDM